MFDWVLKYASVDALQIKKSNKNKLYKIHWGVSEKFNPCAIYTQKTW